MLLVLPSHTLIQCSEPTEMEDATPTNTTLAYIGSCTKAQAVVVLPECLQVPITPNFDRLVGRHIMRPVHVHYIRLLMQLSRVLEDLSDSFAFSLKVGAF